MEYIMKPPKIIKIILVLTCLRLAILLLTLSTAIILVNIEPTSETIIGFKAGFLNAIFGSYYGSITSEQWGYLFGYYFIPIILIISNILFLARPNFWGLIVVLILQSIIGLSNIIGFIYSLTILLIVLLNKDAKTYLKNFHES